MSEKFELAICTIYISHAVLHIVHCLHDDSYGPLRPKKKIVLFPLTWVKNLGSVGRKKVFFFKFLFLVMGNQGFSCCTCKEWTLFWHKTGVVGLQTLNATQRERKQCRDDVFYVISGLI